MCLYKTHNEPRIAQSDIEVWKMLTSEGLSPYQDYPYHPGMNKPLKQKEIPLEQMHINDGYLHAYSDKETAEKYVAMFKLIFFGCIVNPEYIIHRMLIPKGTAYYEGNEGDICAECLYWPEE